MNRIYSAKQLEVVAGLGNNPDKGGWPERWVIVDGPVRSGKTHSTIEGFVAWATNHFEHHDFLVSARQFRLIKANVRPQFETAALKLDLPCQWRSGDSMLAIAGNRFWCIDAQTENAETKIQGMTLAGAYLDEVALMPENFVIAVGERCSIAGAKIVGTCNPREPSHWLKAKYIDKGEAIRCRNISFTLADNPTLTQEYIDALLSTHTGVWLERNVLGKWAAGSGMIWPKFTVCEPPHSEPDKWMVTIDAADRTVTHCLLAGVWVDKLHIVDEWFYDAQQSGELAVTEKVKRYLDYFGSTRQITDWVCDRHAYAELGVLRHMVGSAAAEALNTPGSRAESIDQTYLWLQNEAVLISPHTPHLLASINDFTHEKQSRRIRNATKTDHGADALRNLVWWCQQTQTTSVGIDTEWDTANAD